MNQHTGAVLNSPHFGQEHAPDLTSVAERLELQLQLRFCGSIRDFRLKVRDRGLILRGHAHTYYAKQLAQHAVMDATDLSILANEIVVA